MTELKKFSLVKPTIQMPFHIDFEWWRVNDENWHVALASMLCPEHQEAFANLPEGQMIDWVDPETAEVRQMDGLQYTLIQHCARQAGFLDDHTAGHGRRKQPHPGRQRAAVGPHLFELRGAPAEVSKMEIDRALQR